MAMFAEERRAAIVSKIKSGAPIYVADLVQEFGVSEATIRRDLAVLEKMNLLKRTHGGAVPPNYGLEPTFQEKEIQNLNLKAAIGKLAASLVKDGETILLDAGTTTLQLASNLRGRRITVATNCIDVANVFLDDPHVEVWLLGGILRKGPRSLVGFLTNESLHKLRFDKAFLAANAVDIEFGVTTPNMTEAETKRQMLLAGKEKILVVDHSKLDMQGLCKICDLNELDLLITDEGAEERQIEQLKKKVRVMIAFEGGDKR